MDEGVLLTPKELMARIKVSRATLFRLRKRGLPAVKLAPRTLRFDPAAVDEWLRQQLQEGKG